MIFYRTQSDIWFGTKDTAPCTNIASPTMTFR